MLAALVRLVSGQPEGVLRHLALYGTLVQAETGYAAHQLVRRVVLGLASLMLLGCGLTLAGVAALLAASGLVAGLPTAFWAIPGSVLAAALVLGWSARRAAAVPPYASLRQQLAADAGWLVHSAETSDEPASASEPARAAPRRATPGADGSTERRSASASASASTRADADADASSTPA